MKGDNVICVGLFLGSSLCVMASCFPSLVPRKYSRLITRWDYLVGGVCRNTTKQLVNQEIPWAIFSLSLSFCFKELECDLLRTEYLDRIDVNFPRMLNSVVCITGSTL